jgi:predicted dienelactone hydrolase
MIEKVLWNTTSYITKKRIVATTILFFAYWKAFSTLEFPIPTGPFPVGTTTYHFQDKNRLEPHSQSKNNFRELMVQFWYPAKNKKKINRIPYMPNLIPLMKESIAQNYPYFFPTSLINWLLGGVYTHAEHDTLLSDKQKKYPIILFSHGFASLSNFSSMQLEELASHGYIVVGINHTYDCSISLFPDGRVIPLTQKWKSGEIKYLSSEVNVWVQDVKFILDKLEEINKNDLQSKFRKKLDLEKIGMLGHSLGGATAAQVCRQDGRIKAGVNMDGPLFGSNATEGFSKPFMFILANETMKKIAKPVTDEELSYHGMDRAEEKLVKAMYLESIPKLCQNTKHDAYIITVQGADHYSFSDIPLLKNRSLCLKYFWPASTETIDPYRAISISNDYLLAFFNKYLKNKESKILTNDKQYPEAKVVAYNKM